MHRCLFAVMALTTSLAFIETATSQTTGVVLSWPPAVRAGTSARAHVDFDVALAPTVFDVSLLGAAPGTAFAGVIVPLSRPTVWLDLLGGSSAFATTFVDFTSVTDGGGEVRPRLVLPTQDSLAGIELTMAGILVDGSTPSGIGAVTAAARCRIVLPATAAAGASAPFLAPPRTMPATRYVSPSGSNANDGLSPSSAWREISYAVTHVSPGEVIDVADGNYAGPVIIQSLISTAAAPLVIRALGANAVLSGSGSNNNTNRNSIFIGSSRHVVVSGLKVFASQRAGARVSLSDHVSIENCVFGNHQKWGIFTDYADDLRLIGNECYGSIDEHGIYHSNSGDRAVILGNWCHDNNASGIQINADPAFLSPIGGYVPDGISYHCVVERNRCDDNGVIGGAAINLASVRECVIRNNVITNALWQNSTGIALWDNAAGVQWGSRDNLIEHNTVLYDSGTGRYAVTILNGSTGNVIRNNVLRGGRRGALAFVPDSLPGLISDGNLFSSVDGWPIIVRDDNVFQPFTLAQWQMNGHDAHSIAAAPVLVQPGEPALVNGSVGTQSAIASLTDEDHHGAPRQLPTDVGAVD